MAEALRAFGVAIKARALAKAGALALITPVYCRDPDAKLNRIARYLG
jgi:hypothetical protein